MSWQALGDGELTGNASVTLAKGALESLVRLRAEGGRAPLGWDDLAVLLTQAVSRSSRELVVRKEAKLVGLDIAFEGGASLATTVDDAKPVADELAIVRDAVKKTAASYKDVGERLGRKRPTAHEVVETFRLASADVTLGEAETRKVASIMPRFEHERGQIDAEELVAIIAAAMRRNERRLGLIVEDGASMSPDAVVATADGKTVRAEVSEAPAQRELVDEMSDRFEALVRAHRQEQPDKIVNAMGPQDRERYQRNVDGRGLPTLDALVEQIRRELAKTPERYAVLTTLKLETSERSAFGLPSRPKPQKFVDSRVRVRHSKFGDGYVERTFEDGEKKYEVVFDGGKKMTLMARFLEEV